MISSVDGSSMPKFCWIKNGRTNSPSTSRQINALSYSPRMMEDTSVASTISRSTVYTANTAGCRLMTAFSCGPRCRGAFFLRSIVYPFLSVISIFRYYTAKYEEIQ